MLVLSRKENETIRINGDIEITVVEIRDNQVRLGFVAPEEVKIYRSEVLNRITNTIPSVHFNGNEILDY